MKPEQIRVIIDSIRKRQKENNGKFESGDKFWNNFYAKLFMILFENIKK